MPGYIHGYLEAFRLQLIAEPAAGEVLMIAGFRLRVNIQGDLTVDRVLDFREGEDCVTE